MSTGNVAGKVHVQHHYKDADHQYQSAKQGLWVFMVSEILMFGGLIMAYGIFHTIYPETFQEGAEFLDWKAGFFNTLVLIFSSFTMAMAIYYCQVNERKKAVLALATTIVCGLIFMVVKYFEYTHKFHMGLFPGKYFSYEAAESARLPLYFSFYYCMTGLHGLHVVIGLALITWVLFRTNRGDFGPEYFTPVEGVGLFWHIVDLVWIYLFPILYLIS